MGTEIPSHQHLTEEEKAPTQDAHNAEKCEVPDPGADPPPHRRQGCTTHQKTMIGGTKTTKSTAR